MDILKEVERLLEIERRYNSTLDKLEELGEFIEDWDSGDPDRLPASHYGKIIPVRSVYEFCKRR